MEKDARELREVVRDSEEKLKVVERTREEQLANIDEGHKNLRDEHNDQEKSNSERIASWREAKQNYQALAKDDPGTVSSNSDDMDALNNSIEAVDLDDEPMVVESNEGRSTPQKYESPKPERKRSKMLNTPAKKGMTRMDKLHLEQFRNMKEAGRKLSSLKKANEVTPGNAHIYDCSNIDQLKDTDLGCWENVSYCKVPGNKDLNLGEGQRRQWTSKGNPDLTKIATHYPSENLGIVRYQQKGNLSKLPNDAHQDYRQSSNEGHEVSSVAKPTEQKNRASRQTSIETAEPFSQNRNEVLDDYDLHRKFSRASSDKLLDPAKKKILEPNGGDLYLFKDSSRTNADKAIRDDGLKWRLAMRKETQEYYKEVFYAKDNKSSTNQFQRHVYTSKDGDHTAVHYIGDATLSVPKEGRYSRPTIQ